jgi:hypothetical protein
MLKSKQDAIDRAIEIGEAKVHICPTDGGFVLSVGTMSVCIDRSAAEDIVATLACALASRSGAPGDWEVLPS